MQLRMPTAPKKFYMPLGTYQVVYRERAYRRGREALHKNLDGKANRTLRVPREGFHDTGKSSGVKRWATTPVLFDLGFILAICTFFDIYNTVVESRGLNRLIYLASRLLFRE